MQQLSGPDGLSVGAGVPPNDPVARLQPHSRNKQKQLVLLLCYTYEKEKVQAINTRHTTHFAYTLLCQANSRGAF